MSKVELYTKDHCPYCDQAKRLFDSKGINYKEIDVEHDTEQLKKMYARSPYRTLPQIFINDKCIGGFDALSKLAISGELDKQLNTLPKGSSHG